MAPHGQRFGDRAARRSDTLNSVSFPRLRPGFFFARSLSVRFPICLAAHFVQRRKRMAAAIATPTRRHEKRRAPLSRDAPLSHTLIAKAA
jgi:hypothetical protein